MDFVSIILLGALNIPVFVFFCRLFQRIFFKRHPDFWRSLLSWSFDFSAFFDKAYKHNHFAVLLLSVTMATCIILVLVEYELAYRLVDSIRGYAPLRLLTKI
jgi:hypothetical protein